MRWIPDPTGRFPHRPYYEAAELDHECERVISQFLIDRYGRVVLPIPTDDLAVLLERDAADLDLYADLSGEERQVEGVTDFFPGEKPRVRIAKELSEQGYREHRLRTTLTHEYAHVRFHSPLYDAGSPLPMFPELAVHPSPRCRRDTIIGADAHDWLEWQAGYASGAYLMPLTHLQKVVGGTFVALGLYGSAAVGSRQAHMLIARVASAFQVSQDAARVRLQQLGYLASGNRGQNLLERTSP